MKIFQFTVCCVSLLHVDQPLMDLMSNGGYLSWPVARLANVFFSLQTLGHLEVRMRALLSLARYIACMQKNLLTGFGVMDNGGWLPQFLELLEKAN